MSESIKSLELLAEQFGKLGGVGKRTAMRLAFSVVDMTNEEAERFAEAILEAKRNIHCCPVCQNLTDLDVCPICSDLSRDRTTVCVVADTRSLMAIEKVREYSGVYHVLHGMLSPMQNITPDDIKLRELIERVASEDIKEVIIATNPTPAGDTTAAYLARILEPSGIYVSRLAYGIPVGGDIEYADEVTLYRAMEGRRYFN
jgi:recombination protein RecR